MKVKELIRALSTCHEDAEVFFDEAAVNSVYEVAVRKNENQPWKVKEVVLSDYEDPFEMR